MPLSIKEKIVEQIYKDELSCIDFLISENILYTRNKCEVCNRGTMKRYKSNLKTWHCNYYRCRHKISIFHQTFFANSKIPCHDLMRIGYKWLSGQRYTDILEQTKHSTESVSAAIRFFREAVSSCNFEEDVVIGGQGVVVEVDESKFGKVKYGHGHRVEGVWVVGGVERTADRRIFLKVVPDRSAATLTAILQANIAPGSIILTDLWKGYSKLGTSMPITHQTVNHSKNFKDPVTGTHTNTIEGTWHGIKCKIAPRNRTNKLIDNHLSEFIWRRQNNEDLWCAFLKCLRETRYD
jgi:transposase-like protein